jgi:hypothetical protein
MRAARSSGAEAGRARRRSAPKLVADSLVLRAELCAPLPTLRRRDVAPLLAAACALPLVMLVDEWGETLFSVGAVLLALVAAALQVRASARARLVRHAC